METAVEAMESMEMAPGSWQSARTETSVPQNWSSTAAALQNFSGKKAERFRVFASETFYRRKGDVRGKPGAPHLVVVQPRGHPRHPMVGQPPSPPSALLRSSSRVGKIGCLGFISSNSENIYCVTFLKHKNSRKQGTGTVASR
jgi:hypothetical protein